MATLHGALTVFCNTSPDAPDYAARATMVSVHDMPFGARIMRAGGEGVQFRLWAPAAQCVDLILEPTGSQLCLPMTALCDGWYECTLESARAGLAYGYRIDEGRVVPDPASRSNPYGVEGPSLVVDPATFQWSDADWAGIPWSEAVIYELHIGTFTPEGSYRAVAEKLDYLVDLGVTLIEIMPIASFAGSRGWGYDGVLPFAPSANYGAPEDFKFLVDAAHARGIGVLLDVVYNHLGPEANHLYSYAPQFLSERHHTPWGRAINFDGPQSATVREFYLHNAQYWLEEFHLDGLRLDAVHSIIDSSPEHIVTQIARAVHSPKLNSTSDARARHRHLVLENEKNDPALLGVAGKIEGAEAQWHDDVHHSLHFLLTGERQGYYAPYARCPVEKLGLALSGEFSRESCTTQGIALTPAALVTFLQNHDQIGNRARGERLTVLVPQAAPVLAAAAILLLAPLPVMLFMGEEWGAREPFLYFCDFEAELAQRVREGRRREFAHFAELAGSDSTGLPDPASVDTFSRSRLNWADLAKPSHGRVHTLYRQLLSIRKREIVPLIPQIVSCNAEVLRPGAVLRVTWRTADQSLCLLANLSPATHALAEGERPLGSHLLYGGPADAGASAELPPWSVCWFIHSAEEP